MKKLYFLAATLLATTTLFGQTNLDFENWTAGEPDGWDFTYNILSGIGTLSATPITQQTNNPSVGSSYMRSESVELTGSQDPSIAPDGIYGGFAEQEFASTDEYSSMTVDVKYDIQGSDAGVIVLVGFDASGDPCRLGAQTFTGSEANWETVTFNVNSLNANSPVEWAIRVSSSAEEVLTNQPAAVLGSVLDVDNIVLNLSNPVDNVSNVEASDIDDNCDGSDLQVTFDVPDESNVEAYFLLVTTPNITPGMLADPALAFENLGIELTPNGSNQTHVFSATDEYYFVDGNNLAAATITDDVEMVVHVMVKPVAGFDAVFNVSNNITIECASASLIKESLKDVKVYPNPAVELVNFDFGTTEISELSITNLSGQVVSVNHVNATSTQVDVANLDNGIYFYNAVDAEGNIVATNKFVVSK